MNITNDVVTGYINSFYKPINENMGKLREEAESRKVPIILKETESFLNFFLGVTNPQWVLEIGTAVGYSAIIFANSGAEVISIEKNEEMAKIAKENICKLGFSEKIQVLEGDGEEVINSNFSGTDKTFDLVFIDAAKSHYKRFLEAVLPFCKEGTVIISDNVLLKAATASDEYDKEGKFKTNIRKMRLYLDYITNNPDLETTIIACGDGLALSRCVK